MKLHTYPDYNTMSKAAADLVVTLVSQKPDALICFPSGESPTGLLSYLVQYASLGLVDFSQTNFVGLDEWVGLDRTNDGSCTYFLEKHFFTPLNISTNKVKFFNAVADDLDAECHAMNKHIDKLGGLDMMVVGVGLNGHIGLNEPGADFHSYAHHSPLAPITIEVAQKYFTTDTVLTEGITLGLRHLAEAAVPVLIASGSKKAPIIAQALNGYVTNEVPASIFKTLQNAQVFLDEAAAAQLSLTV
jgi:glucosamine-6-phosphate isomerase